MKMQKDHSGSAPSTPTARIRHRRRSNEIPSDFSKLNGSHLLVDDKNKYRSMWIRAYSSLWMLACFSCILYLGHLYIWAMVVIIQIFMARELFNLRIRAHEGRRAHEDRRLPGFRLLNWYFFFTAMLFVYGRILNQQLVNTVTSEKIFYKLVSGLIKYQMVICYFLYIAGFVWFILTLKKKMYKYQFGQYAWTHMILIVVFTQSSFTVANIFEGIFWFLLPASLIAINDVAAYIFGFFFGRTPLIKLSPKKTWEGFLGASVATVASAFVIANILGRFQWLTCPRQDLSTGWIQCDPGPLFKLEYYSLPRWVPQWFPWTEMSVLPVQWHALCLGLFASIIAPFGGFFASGLKRAFKIKDFGDSIPGHGGFTDRMDCQVSVRILLLAIVNIMLISLQYLLSFPQGWLGCFIMYQGVYSEMHHHHEVFFCGIIASLFDLTFYECFINKLMVMAIFAYIYHQSFVVPQSYPVEVLLNQITRNLSFEEQKALYMKLGQIFQERLLLKS